LPSPQIQRVRLYREQRGLDKWLHLYWATVDQYVFHTRHIQREGGNWLPLWQRVLHLQDQPVLPGLQGEGYMIGTVVGGGPSMRT
jgi:hypothetical protein